MREKYRGLVVCSKVLRVASIIVVVVGTGIILWMLINYGGGYGWSILGAILYICGYLLIGVLMYSLGEVIKLLMNIENEIRDKITGKE